jgi:hypothetical protein
MVVCVRAVLGPYLVGEVTQRSRPGDDGGLAVGNGIVTLSYLPVPRADDIAHGPDDDAFGPHHDTSNRHTGSTSLGASGSINKRHLSVSLPAASPEVPKQPRDTASNRRVVLSVNLGCPAGRDRTETLAVRERKRQPTVPSHERT